MIFVYNETTLELTLNVIPAKDAEELCISTTSVESMRGTVVPITKSKDPLVIAALHKRYGNGHIITYNPSREYTMVDNSRVLIDPTTGELLIRNKEDLEQEKEIKRTLVKNAVVLILHNNSRYYIKKSNLNGPAVVKPFGSEYKIVILYIKTYNWSYLKEKMTILIDGPKPLELDLTYADQKSTNDSNTQYHQNIINVSDYDGTFPTFKKPETKKPESKKFNKGSEDKHYHKDNNQSRGKRNFQDKGFNYSTGRQKNFNKKGIR